MLWLRLVFRVKGRPAMGSLLSRCVHQSPSPTSTSLQEIARQIRDGQIKDIAVMAGAGISTASGIPDFRSPGTGLYDNLQQYQLPYPEAIFELSYFYRRPEPFFRLAKELYPGKYPPNVAHYFPVLLQQKGVLRRMYTQNIDGLERIAGMEDESLVEAHGTFHSATCMQCGKTYHGEDIKADIFAGIVPRCRKDHCTGVIKPNIVFFGEQLPERFFDAAEDMIKADLLVVMGTSLEVYPFAGLAEATRLSVPRLLLNRDAAGTFVNDPRENDIVVKGDIVSAVEKFCHLLGWTEDLKDLMEANEKDVGS